MKRPIYEEDITDNEYTFLRVSVAWNTDEDTANELPTNVFIKVPTHIYDSNEDLNLSGMIEDYFGYGVDDIYPMEVDERDIKHIKDWLLWTADDGLVEDVLPDTRYDEPTNGMTQESRAKPTLLTDKEVAVIDKIVDGSKVDWFALVVGKLGGWFVNDLDNKIQISVSDGLDELCRGVCKGNWQDLYGFTHQDVGIWNHLMDKLRLNPSYKVEDEEISRKLVNEGAGAGYTVRINDLKFGKILDKKHVQDKKTHDDYYVCQVEILPGEYEIEAEDYDNDFFWQEHELGDTPTAKIDGGVATIVYSTNSQDEDEADMELHNELENQELDISFDYGYGWVHADLPKDSPIESDKVNVKNSTFYGGIDKIELNAPDLADAVNDGHQSIYYQDEDDVPEEDEEPINESFGDENGWRVFDYGEDFPFTERYAVFDYDGYEFFISHNGGVGSCSDDAIDEIDSDKISDILEIEIKGKTYRPKELDSDEISNNRIVQKGLKLIKVKYQYEQED